MTTTRLTTLVFLAAVNLIALAALILMTGELLDRGQSTNDHLDQIQQQITDQHHDTLVKLEQIGAGR